MDNITKRAFINAFGTFLYVVLVASFVFSLRFFPKMEDNIFIPISMLLLLVCSAAITGFLVFGKPAMMYVDGKKREAITLLIYTMGILLLINLTSFIFLILYFNLFK